MSIEEFLFSVAAGVVAGIVERATKKKPSFFEKKKIDSKINELVVAVIEPMNHFLESEKITKSTVVLLVDDIVPYVKTVLEEDNTVYSLGLDPVKISDYIVNKKLSTESKILAKEYPSIYDTLLNAIVTMAVRIPPVLSDWKLQSFQANHRMSNELLATLSSVGTKIDQLISNSGPDDTLLYQVISHMEYKSAVKISTQGLRQSTNSQIEIDNLFIDLKFLEYRIDSDFSSTNENPQNNYFLSEHNFEHLSTSTGKVLIESSDKLFEAINKGERALFVAPAGAGKTTWVSWYARQLLKTGRKQLPIIVRLREFEKGKTLTSLLDLVQASIPRSFHDNVNITDVNEWTNDGKLTLLLDGLDEINEDNRDSVVESLVDLFGAYPNLQILLTSRALTTSHFSQLIDQKWRVFSICPFDKQQVEAYIAGYQKHGPIALDISGSESPCSLAEKWFEDPTLGPLTQNPLLLSTLLAVHHMDGKLPNDRSQLYSRYIDGMLGSWETNKDLTTHLVPLTKEQKKELLEIIAINMISIERDSVLETEINGWLEPYICNEGINEGVEPVLQHLCERSGLLIGPGQYSFAHKSIGEFLVAQACVDGIQRDYVNSRFDRKRLESECQNDRWTTVAFLWAGLAPKVETQQFIEVLLNTGKHALAGGLILELCKKLDRDWVMNIIYELIDSGSQPDSFLTQKTFSTISTGLPIDILQDDDEMLYVHNLVNLSSQSVTILDFIDEMVKEGLIDFKRWESSPPAITDTIWTYLALQLGYTTYLELSAPECYSTDRVYSTLATGSFSIDDTSDLYDKYRYGKKYDDYPEQIQAHLVAILAIRVAISACHSFSSYARLEDCGLTQSIINMEFEDLPVEAFKYLGMTSTIDESKFGHNYLSIFNKLGIPIPKDSNFRDLCLLVVKVGDEHGEMGESKLFQFFVRYCNFDS